MSKRETDRSNRNNVPAVCHLNTCATRVSGTKLPPDLGHRYQRHIFQHSTATIQPTMAARKAKDTELYDVLGVAPAASDIEWVDNHRRCDRADLARLKKAYRKMAIKVSLVTGSR